MQSTPRFASLHARASAWTLIAALSSASLAGCGRKEPPPPVDDTRNGQVSADYRGAKPSQVPDTPREEEHAGLSKKQKVVMLAGAAALYYMYKKHKSSEAATGPEGQYYLSKNGRVYYRDAEHRAHWVTPPSNGIEVPESEAAQYREFQGYDNSSTGRDLTGLAEAEAN